MRNVSYTNLVRRRARIIKAVARSQTVIAEIEAEIRRRGLEPVEYKPSRRLSLPGFKQGEIGALCLGILRRASAPLRMREIAALVARQKDLDQTDAALMAAVTDRARGALEATNRRGVTCLVGAPTSRSVRWCLTAGERGHGARQLIR